MVQAPRVNLDPSGLFVSYARSAPDSQPAESENPDRAEAAMHDPRLNSDPDKG